MELCEKLKQIRKENNLTQQQLADELCLSRTVITKYERGHRVPNLDTLILISNYFKTSIFDEYKNKFKLLLLSIKCIIPYLIFKPPAYMSPRGEAFVTGYSSTI